MDRSKKYAIEAAKEITVAVMSEGNLRVDKAGGESVGDFFQAVYSKIEEIAKEIGAERSDVVLALESISDPVSLYEPVYSDSGDTLYVLDQIGDKNDVDSWLDEISLKEAIRDLHPREKNILYLRFFQGKTQVEVANEIGISQAQVSRLEKGALAKVKGQI